MKRSDINILIVEDDSTVRNALKEAFSRNGYTVKATGQPHEAKRYFSLDNYHLLIVDCMLPKINGVDLVENLKKEHGRQFKTILTSGVFKNSTFSKDALHRTQAEHFLYKPIDIEEILEIVQQFFADIIEEEKDPLFELMTHEEISPETIQEAIEKTETIQGRDLPMIYGFLVHAKSSGILNLVDKDGEQSSILFTDGEIIEVQVNDKMSYFGILLIENGFTSTEEVERNLQISNEKPIGLRLVEAHAMSPHAINIALSQQMSIRLSKTIQNNSYSISFTPSQLSINNTKIPSKQFHRLLNDWIYSKIEDDWLIQFYLPWMDYKLHRVKNQKLLSQLNDFPTMKSISQIFKYADEEVTLGELVNEATQNSSELLSLVHFLMIEKLLTLKYSKDSHKDFIHKINTLKKMAEGIEKKSHFEILGLNQKARQKEITRAYMDLVKVLHPDKLDRNAPEELVQLTQRVFSHISNAYSILSDSKKYEKYMKEINWGKAEAAFETEHKIQQGLELLGQGRYTEAYNLFKAAYEKKSIRADIPIYLTWALLKLPAASEKKKYIIDKATKLLKKVPPEERHNAIFFLVKGLYYMKCGKTEKAIVNLKNAQTMDPSLSEAKRELIKLMNRQAKDHSSSTFFQSIFKKKA